jgi:hypothetical protein
VNEHAVHAHGQYFHSELLELGIFLGDRRDFGGSNKGEVTWIEAQQYPFPEILGEFEIDELALMIGRRFEVWGFSSDQDHV